MKNEIEKDLEYSYENIVVPLCLSCKSEVELVGVACPFCGSTNTINRVLGMKKVPKNKTKRGITK